jgi:hypothetical protein
MILDQEVSFTTLRVGWQLVIQVFLRGIPGKEA